MDCLNANIAVDLSARCSIQRTSKKKKEMESGETMLNQAVSIGKTVANLLKLLPCLIHVHVIQRKAHLCPRYSGIFDAKCEYVTERISVILTKNIRVISFQNSE